MVDDPHGTLNDDQLRTVMTQLRREQPYYGDDGNGPVMSYGILCVQGKS